MDEENAFAAYLASIGLRDPVPESNHSDNSLKSYALENPLVTYTVAKKLIPYLINFEEFSPEDKEQFKSCRLVCKEWCTVATNMYKRTKHSRAVVKDGIDQNIVNELMKEPNLSGIGVWCPYPPEVYAISNTLNHLETDFEETKNFPFTQLCFHKEFFGDIRTYMPKPTEQLANFVQLHPSWIVHLDIQVNIEYKLGIRSSFVQDMQVELPNLEKLKFRIPSVLWPLRGKLMLCDEYFYLLMWLLKSGTNLHDLDLSWHVEDRFSTLLQNEHMYTLYSSFLECVPSKLKVLKMTMISTPDQFEVLHSRNLELEELHCKFYQPDEYYPLSGCCQSAQKFLNQQRNHLKKLVLYTEGFRNKWKSANFLKITRVKDPYEIPLCPNLEWLELSEYCTAEVNPNNYPSLKHFDIKTWRSLEVAPDLLPFSSTNICTTLSTLSLHKEVTVAIVEKCAKVFPNVKELVIQYDCDIFGYNYDSNPLVTTFREFSKIQCLTIHFWAEYWTYRIDPVMSGIPLRRILQWETGDTEKYPEDLSDYKKFPSISHLKDLRELKIVLQMPTSSSDSQLPITVGKATVQSIIMVPRLQYFESPQVDFCGYSNNHEVDKCFKDNDKIIKYHDMDNCFAKTYEDYPLEMFPYSYGPEVVAFF